MICLYKGPRGTGKTIGMIKDGIRYKEKGYKILSNFWTNFSEIVPNEFILELDKHADLYNCVILIDEIQTLFDSRSFATQSNKTFSYFLQQIRKRNIHILCTTQYSNTIDLRLRQHIDIVAFPQFIKEFNICKIKYFDITQQESFDQKMIYGEIWFKAEKLFDCYNTKELIK